MLFNFVTLKKPENFFLISLLFVIFLFFLFGFSYIGVLNFFLATYNPELTFSDFRCIQQWGNLYNFFFLESLKVYSHITDCILNHPRIWILVSKLFYLENNYYFIFSILFFILIYILIFFYSIKKFQSFFLLYFFFSGVSLLLLERGNNDLIIFIIIFFSLNINNILFSYLFFLIACFLKIFPVFGFFSFFNKFKNIKTIFIATLPIIFYFLFTYSDNLRIFFNTPKTGDMSYGSFAIQYNVFKHFKIEIKSIYISLVLVLISFSVYLFLKKKFLKNLKFVEEDPFLMGSCIYICSFLISSNFDYRLIFLFFTIPCLLKLNNNFLKNISLISICLSSELYRLISIFGFYGGAVNTLFKLILLVLLIIITVEILLRKIKKYEYFVY